jgi:hypothetical protein
VDWTYRGGMPEHIWKPADREELQNGKINGLEYPHLDMHRHHLYCERCGAVAECKHDGYVWETKDKPEWQLKPIHNVEKQLKSVDGYTWPNHWPRSRVDKSIFYRSLGRFGPRLIITKCITDDEWICCDIIT